MFLRLSLIASIALSLTGCASTQPVAGALYADVKGPVTATNRPRGPLSGQSCATSYLGLVALGDASITAASKAGGVLAISHVEQHSTNILGIISKYCTIVWGVKGGTKSAASGSTSAAE